MDLEAMGSNNTFYYANYDLRFLGKINHQMQNTIFNCQL